MSIPAWLQRHLEDRGLWDSDRISRTVRARRCKKCRALVFAGLDAVLAGGPVQVDPTPLSPTGEACALVLGRTTYALAWRGGRLELDFRVPAQILHSPAGTTRYDVVAAHACGSRPLPSIPTVHADTTAADYTGDPPF